MNVKLSLLIEACNRFKTIHKSRNISRRRECKEISRFMAEGRHITRYGNMEIYFSYILTYCLKKYAQNDTVTSFRINIIIAEVLKAKLYIRYCTTVIITKTY